MSKPKVTRKYYKTPVDGCPFYFEFDGMSIFKWINKRLDKST